MTPNSLTDSLPRESHRLRGYFYVAAATLCFAISATLGRAVFTGGLIPGAAALPPISPLLLSQSRITLALLVVAPVLLLRRGRAALRMERGDWLRVLLLGVLGVAPSNYFYYLAVQLTNVATAIILQYTAPVWVLLYMVARGYQRPTFQRVSSVALAVVGSALAIGIVGAGQFRASPSGVVAALAAAITFAYYTIGVSDLLLRHDRWKILFYILLGTSAFWAVLNPPWHIVAAHYSRAQWIFLGVFSFISILAPYSFYIAGLQYLDSTRAIVTSCLEPAFSITLAALFLSELVRPLQVLGILVVLVATIVVQLPSRREKDQRVPVTVELIE